MIGAEELATRLAGLEGIGVSTSGVNRLAWTAEDEACRGWFSEQAARLGRTTERDPAGNLWAPPPDAEPPWWGTGSHLDSVRDGGPYDGPLGVAAAFAIAERTSKPVAVVSFADEEGARFNTPTFGSRALAGRLDTSVLDREDDDGVSLRNALEQAGLDPDRIHETEQWRARLEGFLELHIDQTTDLARADAPYGVVTRLAARARLQVDLTGRADHAGTTPPGERRDALSAAARLIVAAEEAAAEHADLRVTASRMHIEPNALTTIASFVRLWLDARAPEESSIDTWLQRLDGSAAVTVASRSPAVTFDRSVREAIAGGPELLCFAGHDAGVLQGAGIPAGMVFVRNPTGVSHSPEEHVDLEDAARAATAVLDALEHRLP